MVSLTKKLFAQHIKIPDWKKYKVEDCPDLLKVQEALAEKGLKDPWLRNEVWRYTPKEFGTHGQRVRTFFLRGLPYGLAAFVVTVIVETLWNVTHRSSHHHGKETESEPVVEGEPIAEGEPVMEGETENGEA